jgi:hypothetical protein
LQLTFVDRIGMLIPLASASPLRLEGIGAGVGGNADETANSVRKELQSESKAVDARVIPARRAEWKPGHIRWTLRTVEISSFIMVCLVAK